MFRVFRKKWEICLYFLKHDFWREIQNSWNQRSICSNLLLYFQSKSGIRSPLNCTFARSPTEMIHAWPHSWENIYVILSCNYDHKPHKARLWALCMLYLTQNFSMLQNTPFRTNTKTSKNTDICAISVLISSN